jgi:magnesium-transporting ATPase (P-type)
LIPLSPFEQFRVVTSFYFLLVVLLAFIPGASIGPLFSIIPLVFALLVSLIKSTVEDLWKRADDKRQNSAQVKIWRDGDWVAVQSGDIHPGAVVRQEGGTSVACDML